MSDQRYNRWEIGNNLFRAPSHFVAMPSTRGYYVKFRNKHPLKISGVRSTTPLSRLVSNPAEKSRALVKRRMLIEQLCQRQVLASVSGLVFEDANASWRLDNGELVQPNRLVFVDLNNDGIIGENEPVATTDDLGKFDFSDLTVDETIVRLFNGSSQAPQSLFPLAPVVSGNQLAFTDGTSIASLVNKQLLSIAGDSIIRGNLDTGVFESILLPGAVRGAQPLPSGATLVLASDAPGNQSFVIDAAGVVTPIVLESATPTAIWQDVAIDKAGNGFLIEKSLEDSALRTIAVGESITVGSTSTLVGAGTRVTGGGELTTVISTPTDDGLRLQLWSNATGTQISSGGVEVAGGIEVLSYDDASGLVLVRSVLDKVAILDAAADFATLQTLDARGVIAIDGQREVLFVISPTVPLLKIVDLNTAKLLGEFEFDASVVADAIEMQFDASLGKLVVLTASGVSPIKLLGSAAKRVRFAEETSTVEVVFALGTAGPIENTPPRFNELPVLTTPEDTVLSIPAPELLRTAVDDQGDRFVVILDEPTRNGTVVVTPTGGLVYSPNADFFGVDQFSVILHDGHSPSESIELSITVTPVNDPLDFFIAPELITEETQVNQVVGDVAIIDVDRGNITWNISDPRFGVVGPHVVVRPGAIFRVEDDATLDVEFTAHDSTSDDTVTKIIRFNVVESLELDVKIEPDTATIDENIPGELIAEIRVIDDGEGAQYQFTIDDDRFLVDVRDLRLKPGVALDFEREQTVTVNITATNAVGQFKTEPMVITVRDIGEQAAVVALSSQRVMELVRGAVVGDVLVDGRLLSSGYIASVDDQRFEISGSTLKLRDSEFVRVSEQEQIQVVVTIKDAASAFLPIAGTFIISVLANSNPFHNEDNPFDVNADGVITPLDALMIINGISRSGGPGPISGFPSPDRFFDVNGDRLITPLDALLVINRLNRLRRGELEQPSDPTSPNNSAIGTIGPTGESESATESNVDPVESPLAPLSLSAKPKLVGEMTAYSQAELAEIRDQVIESLAGEADSSDSEITAATEDFLGFV